MKFIRSLLNDKRGVSALEYAILAAVIIGVTSVALGKSDGSGSGLSSQIKAVFSSTSTNLSNATK